MQLPVPHRPAQQIERELAQLRRQLQNADPLPSIPALEAAVQKWTTKTALDPIHRPDLYEATKAVEAAQEVWQQRARDNGAIRQLENELNEATAAERLERATQADSNLGNAIAEYRAACLIAAKSLRHLLTEQHRAAQVAGANSNISALRVEGFHIPHLQPMSFQGTLGQGMIQGTVGFEQQNDFGIRPTLKQVA